MISRARRSNISHTRRSVNKMISKNFFQRRKIKKIGKCSFLGLAKTRRLGKLVLTSQKSKLGTLSPKFGEIKKIERKIFSKFILIANSDFSPVNILVPTGDSLNQKIYFHLSCASLHEKLKAGKNSMLSWLIFTGLTSIDNTKPGKKIF